MTIKQQIESVKREISIVHIHSVVYNQTGRDRLRLGDIKSKLEALEEIKKREDRLSPFYCDTNWLASPKELWRIIPNMS